MNKSPDIGKLMEALAKAQLKLENPKLDKVNPHFKSKYASLAAIRDAVIPTLAAEGLTLTQWLSSGENSLRCETMISHSSGEWISETLDLPVSKHDAQGFASAATYARRIGMQSAVGVTGDEDDDAEAAVKGSRNGKEPITARGGARELVKDAQLEQIDKLASGIVDAFSNGTPVLAYRKYMDAKAALAAYGADAHVALWDKFDSGQRAALKKIGMSEMAGGQA